MPRKSSTTISSIKLETDGSTSTTSISMAESSSTPLRRSTRSNASTSTTPILTPTTGASLDLSSYAYQPAAGPSTPRKRIKLEPNDPEDALVPITPKKDEEDVKPTPKSSAKKAMPLERLAKAHPAPARWEQQYRLIEKMRRGIIAPVDDMGCERPRTSADVDPKTLRFHILISLMLSSQTKDAVTSQAVDNLHRDLPGGLTAQSLAEAPVEKVHECINKVGFWRRKTEYIQDAARHILNQPGELRGDVPNTIEGLCELKGVGPKMAFLCLQCAWDMWVSPSLCQHTRRCGYLNMVEGRANSSNAGIGVDVHVHRITNRLKWHKPPTQTPEQTRVNLESWLPPELHKPINPMLVGFGQVICLPVGPRCDVCLLGKQKLCPSRVSNVKAEGRKEVVYTFTDGEEEETAKVEVKYEGLMRIKDEDGVKIEPSDGMERVEQVLEVLDKVDGPREIGS